MCLCQRRQKKSCFKQLHESQLRDSASETEWNPQHKMPDPEVKPIRRLILWTSPTDNVDTILETKLLWLPRRSVNAVYVSHLPTLPTQSKISPHQNDVEHCENFLLQFYTLPIFIYCWWFNLPSQNSPKTTIHLIISKFQYVLQKM